MNIRELMQKRATLIGQARALVDRAEAEKRGLTDEERGQYDGHMKEVDVLSADIARLQQLEKVEASLTPDKRISSADPGDQHIGLSGKEVQRYSILRAIRAAATSDWRGAELEREASDAVAVRIGKSPHSFFVPSDVTMAKHGAEPPRRVRVPGLGWQYLRADLTKAGDGGNLIATDLLAGDFIELLRNRLAVTQAGARVLTDLVGDVDIARQISGGTGYWVGEGSAPTESDQGLDKLSLAPKTVGGFTEISRKMLRQSSIDAEMFVRDDLNQTLALAIDLAALHGTGSGNQPTGVALTSGVGLTEGGTDGAAPDWANVVELESDVSVANADVGSLAYITNALVRGKLKTTPKEAGQALYCWGDGNTPLNGYSAFVSNQVRSNLTKGIGTNLSAIFFGNWFDLIMAMWGVIDILVNPFSNDTAGAVRVTALQDIDVGVRHPASFSVMLDAITS